MKATPPRSGSLDALVDEVCDTFEQAWGDGRQPRIEDYLERVAPAHRAELFAELLLSECECRRRRGAAASAEDYLPRFPEYSDRIVRVFAQRARNSEGAGHDSTQTDAGRRTRVQHETPPPRNVGGYELLGEVARGGMGVVYQARQPGLNRIVALKMILTGDWAGADELARFRREAETAARLQHPNIVQVHEVGQQDGRPFLAMEYVDGGNLARRLNDAPLGPAAAARLIELVARAVHYAHERGVLHRDLKPANILLAEDRGPGAAGSGRQGGAPPDSALAALIPKISDFGLAKCLAGEAGAGTLTQTGMILGTPSYMSPEQAAGTQGPIGPAADVWSLGAILYETLTGRPPFRGPTPMETLWQVRQQEPVAPRSLQPKAPADLETICLKCLHKDPARRYASALALAEDLGRFQEGRPIAARAVGPWEHGWRWCRRNPWVAGLIAAVLLVAVVGTTVATVFAVDARDKKKLADDKTKDAQAKEAEASAEKDRVGRLLHDAKMNLAQGALLAKRPHRLAALLAETRPAAAPAPPPKGRAALDLRRFEWHYFDRQGGFDLPGFEFSTMSMDDEWEDRARFSRDGQWLGTLTMAGRIVEPVEEGGGLDQIAEFELQVRDSSSGKVLFTHKARQGINWRDLGLNPAARRILRGDGKNVHILDFDTGKVLGTLTLEQRLQGLAVDPAFRLLAVTLATIPGVQGGLEVWDLEERKLAYRVSTPKGLMNWAFSFSPDGRRSRQRPQVRAARRSPSWRGLRYSTRPPASDSGG